MSLRRLIEAHWQQPKTWLTPLLLPLSWLFGHIAHHRRQGHLKHPERARKLPVPVVVVGNIHIGGTGKTPIVQALVRQLQQHGIAVGTISRGYGRSEKHPHLLTPHSTAEQAGDEPLMLYRSTGAPTAVAADRHQAGLLLLQHHPELQLIVADDGLQHHRLHRDYEIAIYPAADLHRQPAMLPQGKLREPLSRLNSVNALIISQAQSDTPHFPTPLPPHILQGHSTLQIGQPYLLENPQQTLNTGHLKPQTSIGHTPQTPKQTTNTNENKTATTHNIPNTNIHPTPNTGHLKPQTVATPPQHFIAVAAIARPERFIQTLEQLGIPVHQTLILPDHATWQAQPLPPQHAYITTEKDAAKLPQHNDSPIWVVPIRAQLPDNLLPHLLAHCLPDHHKETTP